MASPHRTPEFRAEVVRIALTSGLSRKQVAADLGVHCPVGDACIAVRPVLCEAKPMRFAFIAKNKDMLPVKRLCQIMDITAFRVKRESLGSRLEVCK